MSRLSHFTSARSIFRDGPETTHIYLAVTINNLAKLYGTQGKYEQAELLMQQALAMREQELGRKNLDIANSLQIYTTFAMASTRGLSKR